MPSRTARCPRWCACNHSADTSGAAFYHASETLSVAISRLGDPAVPDRLDVQAAQYLPDDPRSRGLASLVGTPDPRRPVRVPSLDRSQRTAVRAGIGAL